MTRWWSDFNQARAEKSFLIHQRKLNPECTSEVIGFISGGLVIGVELFQLLGEFFGERCGIAVAFEADTADGDGFVIHGGVGVFKFDDGFGKWLSCGQLFFPLLEDRLIQIIRLIFRVAGFEGNAGEFEVGKGVGRFQGSGLGGFLTDGNGFGGATRFHRRL